MRGPGRSKNQIVHRKGAAKGGGCGNRGEGGGAVRSRPVAGQERQRQLTDAGSKRSGKRTRETEGGEMRKCRERTRCWRENCRGQESWDGKR